MADKKITQLSGATTPLAGTELVELVQSGTNVKATAQDVADLVDLTTIQGDIATLQTNVSTAQTDITNLQAGKQDNITLTTSGTSGAATFISNTLNIPDYSAGTGGGIKSGTATAAVTDVYTTTISGVTSYTTNDAYIIKFNTANSDGATLNISGVGAVQLVKNNDVIITGGDISVGQEFIVIYDGTNFQMIGIAPNQMFAYVTNADSVTINKGQPVYAFGASGDRMSVKLANNTSEATSSKTVGLVFSSSIAAGGLGFIITQGVLSNVNTAAYSPGDTLYVGNTSGALTNTMPTAPNHLTRIGIVERANAGNGLIYVLVQNGFQLDELSDVDITSTLPVNNDVLTYVTGVNNLWKPRSISTILGYTPEDVANKSTTTTLGTSNTLYPTQNAVKTYVDSGTTTLTNKRITARTGTVASSATPTINTDNVDYYSITALAVAITSMTTNLSGTPTTGQTLWISITDNGTARAITWGASFEASGNVALPTTTVISTRLDVAFIWNEATSKWRCVGVA